MGWSFIGDVSFSAKQLFVLIRCNFSFCGL
nr:MAG TPA: hypothetical protein [Caudoviricetes sp.]